MFSPLLALATYLDHVHHAQCACRYSVQAWHWQQTWTGVGYASKPTNQVCLRLPEANATEHSGSAGGTQVTSSQITVHHFVAMCASGEPHACCMRRAVLNRRCVKQDHVALLFHATTAEQCTTGASTCASHCTSNSLRSPPAGQAPALYCDEYLGGAALSRLPAFHEALATSGVRSLTEKQCGSQFVGWLVTSI